VGDMVINVMLNGKSAADKLLEQVGRCAGYNVAGEVTGAGERFFVLLKVPDSSDVAYLFCVLRRENPGVAGILAGCAKP